MLGRVAGSLGRWVVKVVVSVRKGRGRRGGLVLGGHI